MEGRKEKGMLEKSIVNQYGDAVDEYRVIYHPAKGWYEETLTCYGSSNLGLGTCRCVSHTPYTSRRLSRLEVIDLFGKDFSTLTEEERADLEKAGDFEEDIREKMSLLGFSWEAIEDWAAECYRLGLNPLPTLRKKLSVEARFAYEMEYGGFSGFEEESPFLACYLSQDGEEVEGVRIEAVIPL
jgi:hypothetical protein